MGRFGVPEADPGVQPPVCPGFDDEADDKAKTHGHGYVRLTCPACGHHGVYQAAHPEHRQK